MGDVDTEGGKSLVETITTSTPASPPAVVTHAQCQRDLQSANERIEAMTAQLAECYRLSGADTDGDEEWRYAPNAVAEVRRLRTESDEDEERLIDIRSQLSALQRAAREYIAVVEPRLDSDTRWATQGLYKALMDLLK